MSMSEIEDKISVTLQRLAEQVWVDYFQLFFGL
jgi:hypothetical protein